MVSVAVVEVSMTMSLTSFPLRKYLRPRLWSTLSVTVAPRSEAGRAGGATSFRGPWDHPRLHRQQALALQFLARELAGAADGFRLLSDSLLGGCRVMAEELHLAEDALALHLLLQHLESLVDIVVTDEYLHAAILFDRAVDWPDGGRAVVGHASETGR